MFHSRFFICLLILATASAALPASAAPPALDGRIRAALGAMQPLTTKTLPPLKGKVVVVSFFASWCPPCTDEFKQLNRLQAAVPADKLAIIALNLFEGFFEKGQKPRMARFLKRTAPAFPVLSGFDDDALSALFNGVERIPTVFVFDAAGKPVFSFIHAVDATKRHANSDELLAVIRPLIETQ
jgi:thiol-disulfide isomerase/thioredoxin